MRSSVWQKPPIWISNSVASPKMPLPVNLSAWDTDWTHFRGTVFIVRNTVLGMRISACNVTENLQTKFQVQIRNDDVIKWKHFLCYWPFVRGIHRSSVNSPHKGQWRGALMFSLICAWINGRVNSREAGDLRRHRFHYDVTVSTVMAMPAVVSILRSVSTCQEWSQHHGNV